MNLNTIKLDAALACVNNGGSDGEDRLVVLAKINDAFSVCPNAACV